MDFLAGYLSGAVGILIGNPLGMSIQASTYEPLLRPPHI